MCGPIWHPAIMPVRIAVQNPVFAVRAVESHGNAAGHVSVIRRVWVQYVSRALTVAANLTSFELVFSAVLLFPFI